MTSHPISCAAAAPPGKSLSLSLELLMTRAEGAEGDVDCYVSCSHLEGNYIDSRVSWAHSTLRFFFREKKSLKSANNNNNKKRPRPRAPCPFLYQPASSQEVRGRKRTPGADVSAARVESSSFVFFVLSGCARVYIQYKTMYQGGDPFERAQNKRILPLSALTSGLIYPSVLRMHHLQSRWGGGQHGGQTYQRDVLRQLNVVCEILRS